MALKFLDLAIAKIAGSSLEDASSLQKWATNVKTTQNHLATAWITSSNFQSQK